MSVDSGEPRQRTVAELLAANGGSQPGRRRRRRAEDGGGPAVASPPPPPPGPGPDEHPSFPTRRSEPGDGAHNGPRNGAVPFVPNGNAPPGRPPHAVGQNGAAPHGVARGGVPPYGRPAEGFAPFDDGPPARTQGPRPVPRPADGPHRGDGPDHPDDVPTGRFGARATPPPVAEDGGPPTMLGAPPLDDDEDDVPTARTPARPPAGEAGPPTGAYAPFVDDGYTRYDEYDHDDRYDEYDRDGGYGRDGGYDHDGGYDRYDDGYDRHEGHDGADGPGGEPGPDARTVVAAAPEHDAGEPDAGDPPPAGLGDGSPTGAVGTGQAWAVVIAQWIGGAVAGAAIWVGFRFLWFSLPIVALALAVVLTVGLVLGVRALLRNDDLKTTLFAVLVGLLLTVSPAILVLLER